MQEINKVSRDRLNGLGELVVGEIKEFLSGSGSGRMYKRSKSAWYQASAPGQPPVVKSGELKGSMAHALEELADIISLYVGTPKDYGLFLQLGTVKMLPRPWLDVILKRLEPSIKQDLVGEEWAIH